jgi:hypothetical protein
MWYLLSLYFGCGMIRKKPGPHVNRGVDTGFPWATDAKGVCAEIMLKQKLKPDNDSS